MNNENFHPVLEVPPLAHALHRWKEETKTLTYEYNGIDIISMQIPENDAPGFRHGSDGTVQSIQYIQQIYITVEHPVEVIVTFNLSSGAINMKHHRANGEEAILGQLGNVLMEGINGLYDKNQDLFLTFHGAEWTWADNAFTELDGRKIARAAVRLTEKPFFINLKMFYYKNHLGYSYYEPWKNRFHDKTVSGWCSWEAFRRDIDIRKIAAISEFMEKKLKDYGLEYIQVDDGYQKMPLPYDPKGDMSEGWLTCEEKKFPGGHREIIETIQKKGFSPAIWTNANITNPLFPEHHKDSVIFWEGKPLKGEWIDFLYNCTPETLEKQVEPIFQGFQEAGYQYLKIDAIRHLLFDGLHEAVRLGMMTNEDAGRRFRSYLEATRKGLGKDIYYLASWGEMHEVIGVADACRISMDANPTWAGIRMQMFEMARWFHTQRILFLNDPDHVCVRTKLEWAKSVLSLISLSGGLYMLSDTIDAYTDEKLEVIRKTLPPLQTVTGETGMLNMDFPAYTWTKLHGFAVQSHETPVEMEDISLKDVYDMAGNYPGMEDEHPFSTLWAIHLNRYESHWCVMGRFATIPLQASEIELKKLGLSGEKKYHAFDFWQEQYLGIVKERIACKALEIGQCQIVCLREVQEFPQFLASSRHVSMDAVSVIKAEYRGNEFELQLSCVPEAAENYYLYLPRDYEFVSLQSSGAEVQSEISKQILKLRILAHQKEVSVKLYFKLLS